MAPRVYCFPGGAIEGEESEEETLVREFREEVGGEVRPLARVWEYTRPDGSLRLYWWRADLVGDKLECNPAEIAELRWLTPGEILTLPNLLDGNRAFLATLR